MHVQQGAQHSMSSATFSVRAALAATLYSNGFPAAHKLARGHASLVMLVGDAQKSIAGSALLTNRRTAS